MAELCEVVKPVTVRGVNIVFCAFLLSLLITEMVSGALFPLYVIRYIQFLILFNGIILGFRPMSSMNYFIIPASIFILMGIPYFNEADILGDFFNIFWWTCFMFILNYSLKDFKDFYKFRGILIKATFFLISGFAMFSFFKLYLLVNGVVFENLTYLNPITDTITPILGTSLNKDYNIYSFGVLCGVFAGMYCYKNTIYVRDKILYSILMLFCLFSGILSMSRRGFVIGTVLLLFIVIWSFKSSSWSPKENLIKTKQIRKPWFFIVFFLFLIFVMTRINFKDALDNSQEVLSLVNRIETINEINSEENNTRGNRWEYSFEYYKSLPVLNKIFGASFAYMEIFGAKFEEARIDHPHNVWISSLLYGGIFGFLTTCWLSGYVLYLYIKRRKYYGVLFWWYLLFLILIFTSSNTIFSSRPFVVLTLFPFLNFISKKNSQQMVKKINT